MALAWDDLRLFLAAWEAGTLSGAAAELGLAQATLSRRVALFEDQLGHVLFERTRRGLVPTPAARALHPHALVMAATAREAAAAVQGLSEAPAGEVRIAVPPGAAVDVLHDLVPRVAAVAPAVRLCILADNRMRDLVRHEADIALRSWPPETGELVVRRLPAFAMGVFASPALAARLGPRPAVAELPFVQWSDELAHIPQARAVEGWLGGRPAALRANSFHVLREAARLGLGCMLMPRFQGERAGLVGIDLPMPPGLAAGAPVYLVMPRALRRLPRVRVVADAVVEMLTAAAAVCDDGPLAPGAPPGCGADGAQRASSSSSPR